MEPKEIILQTIRGEKAERVSTALLSAGAWTFNRKGFKLSDLLDKPELAAKIITETAKEAKSDIVWPSSGYHNLLIQALGGKIIFREKGTMDVAEPLLKTRVDIAKVDLKLLQQSPWINNIWETAGLVHQAIGEKFLVGSSSWGPFTLAGQLYGVEKLMSGLYKDKEGVKKVLEFSTKVCLAYLKPFVQKGVEIISIAEPTASGDMISRRHFENFVYPYLQNAIKEIKKEGALVTLHICGNITNRLDLVAETGVDLLSVDYKVDLEVAKEIVGEKTTLAGNVNPVLLQKGSLQEVGAAAKSCLEKAAAQGRYVLMPGCDIPPSVPLENIHTFFETALNWQI